MSIVLRYYSDGVSPPSGTPEHITSIKAHSTSVVDQSNVFVEFGLPLAPGQFDPTQERIVTGYQTQETDHVYDLSGDCRWLHLTVLVPLLSAGGDVVIDVSKEVGSPTGNIAKTVSELIALDTDFEVKTNIVTHNGASYSMSCLGALQASTVWDKTNAHLNEGFVRDGPLSKVLKCSSPARGPAVNSKIRTFFYVTYFSTDGFATLAAIRVTRTLCNGIWELTHTGISELCLASITDTTGLASPSNAYQLTSRSPAQTLTLTLINSNSGNDRVFETNAVTPGTFDKHDHGRPVYTADDWFGIIQFVNSDGSQARIMVDRTMDARASLPSGNWTIGALAVPYKAGPVEEIWYKGTGDYYPLPKYDHLTASQLMFNYNRQVANLPAIDPQLQRDSYGDNPSAIHYANTVPNGSLYRGVTMFNNTSIYELRDSFMDHEHRELQRVDADGFVSPEAYELIFETNRLWQNTEVVTYINADTGLHVHWSDTNLDGPVYQSPNNNDHLNALPFRTSRQAWMEKNPSHEHSTWFVCWMLKGDWKHMEWAMSRMSYQFYRWMAAGGVDDDLLKPGNGRWVTKYGQQFRSCTHMQDNFYRAALMMPSSVPSSIASWTQSGLRDYVAYNSERMHSWNVGNPPTTDPEIVSRAGHSHDNSDETKGFLRVQNPGGDQKLQIHGYQESYHAISLAHIKEIGMMDSNLAEYATGIYRNYVLRLLDPALLAIGPTDTDVQRHMLDRPGAWVKDLGVGGPYPSYADLHAQASGNQSSTNYIAMEWQVYLHNLEHGFYGTIVERQAAYEAACEYGNFKNRITLSGAIPDPSTVGSWHGSWQAHYMVPRD